MLEEFDAFKAALTGDPRVKATFLVVAGGPSS